MPDSPDYDDPFDPKPATGFDLKPATGFDPKTGQTDFDPKTGQTDFPVAPEPKAEPESKPAQLAQPAKPDKIQQLIDKHFPHLADGGVEAHQPLREFLLELRDLL
jgi:hypothetical protein